MVPYELGKDRRTASDRRLYQWGIYPKSCATGRVRSMQSANQRRTDPIRDCAGNPVPDGTVVTFTARDGDQVSTVDAPVKKDVARAEIEAKGPVTISAASGVVMGNELRLGGQE